MKRGILHPPVLLTTRLSASRNQTLLPNLTLIPEFPATAWEECVAYIVCATADHTALPTSKDALRFTSLQYTQILQVFVAHDRIHQFVSPRWHKTALCLQEPHNCLLHIQDGSEAVLDKGQHNTVRQHLRRFRSSNKQTMNNAISCHTPQRIYTTKKEGGLERRCLPAGDI